MKKICLLAVLAILLFSAGNLFAATEAEKRAAIDDGLAWLAATQGVGGNWLGSGDLNYQLATAGAAILAFMEEKDNWGANAVAYQAVVDKAVDFVLSRAVTVNIGMQPAGNPDSNGDGKGAYFFSGDHQRDTYLTGIIATGLASTGTPTKLITAGALAGLTYQQALQNVNDYFAFGQSDPATGVYRGGWRYTANQGSSDQSTTQWPVIAALFASPLGVTTPAFVKTELEYWVNYIQKMPEGYAGYMAPTLSYGEMGETGALLIMLDWLGYDLTNAKVVAALDWLNDHWQSVASATWDGNFGHPYAMWAIYKGLETTIGLDNMTAITNLHAAGVIDNPDHGWNWWEDYCEYLVNLQAVNGSWPGYSNWNAYLATPWYINILAATELPSEVPEPSTLLLLGSGLVALAGFAKMRRKKS